MLHHHLFLLLFGCFCILSFLQACQGRRRWPVSFFPPGRHASSFPLSLIGSSKVSSSAFASSSMELLPEQPHLVRGMLANGLKYVILPNSQPKGQFEARLEILSGSTSETLKQRGMAHLLEHVVFMDSPSRRQLSSLGAHTNAYTDFHQTVFTATSPLKSSYQSLLPLVLQSFRDVFLFGNESRISTLSTKEDYLLRLQKEQSAVMGEASLVHSPSYIKEADMLRALHSENRISDRFPIGELNQIEKWNLKDLLEFHHDHYTPDNAVLYIVGDILQSSSGHPDLNSVESIIKGSLGELSGKAKQFSDESLAKISRHFPPVLHSWSMNASETFAILAKNIFSKELKHEAQENATDWDAIHRISEGISKSMSHCGASLPEPCYIQSNSSSYNIRLFAKNPIESISGKEQFRRNIMRRMILSALSMSHNLRLNGGSSDVDWQDLPREGCAVTLVNIEIEQLNETQQPKVAHVFGEVLQQVRNGLDSVEFDRLKGLMLFEYHRTSNTRSSPDSNSEVIEGLMVGEACGHSCLNATQEFNELKEAFMGPNQITLEEVNSFAKNVLGFLEPSESPRLSAVIVSIPRDASPGSSAFSKREISEALTQVWHSKSSDMTSNITLVPAFLVNRGSTNSTERDDHRDWNSSETSAGQISSVILDNGLRVNFVQSIADDKPNQIAVKLEVAPSKTLNKVFNQTLLTELAVRMLQDGGKLLGNSRQSVELFCVENGITLDAYVNRNSHFDDGNRLEKQFPPLQDAFNIVSSSHSSPAFSIDLTGHIVTPKEYYQEEMKLSNGSNRVESGKLSGLEALFQLLHGIVTDFEWSDESFLLAQRRVRDLLSENRQSLERSCLRSIQSALYEPDVSSNLSSPDRLAESVWDTSYFSSISCAHIERLMSRLFDPRQMILTISTTSELPPHLLKKVLTEYAEAWPANPLNVMSTSVAPSLMPSASPTRQPHHRWRRDSKDCSRRRMRIKRGNRAVFWLPNGTFPGGWFYGMPDFTMTAENTTGFWKERNLPRQLRNGKSATAADGPARISTRAIPAKSIEFNLTEARERGVGYLAGYGPNMLGLFPLESTVLKDPFSGVVSVMVLKEIINQKLYEAVREKNQLAYDAYFQMHSFDSIANEWNSSNLPANWYTVSVIAAPEKVKDALTACTSTLSSLSPSNVHLDCVKQTVRVTLEGLLSRNSFWLQLASSMPAKFRDLGDKDIRTGLLRALDHMTVEVEYLCVFALSTSNPNLQDINGLIEKMNFNDNLLTCVGFAGPEN